jgi:hypothetical protein
LTHFASRGIMTGSIFDNTPDNIRKWLKDRQPRNPGRSCRISASTPTGSTCWSLSTVTEMMGSSKEAVQSEWL